MTDYIGIAVHGTRRQTPTPTLDTVTRVVATGIHRYQPGNQCEPAIKAATDRHPHPRWYVGYGADYIPANSDDIANIEC